MDAGAGGRGGANGTGGRGGVGTPMEGVGVPGGEVGAMGGGDAEDDAGGIAPEGFGALGDGALCEGALGEGTLDAGGGGGREPEGEGGGGGRFMTGLATWAPLTSKTALRDNSPSASLGPPSTKIRPRTRSGVLDRQRVAGFFALSSRTAADALR